MKINKLIALLLSCAVLAALCACGRTETYCADVEAERTAAEEAAQSAAPAEESMTDMIGRELDVTAGSYKRVVCIGAGALRLYSYIGDMPLLCGVEDIDNVSLSERPKMFDSVARPYMLAYSDLFSALPSCGVGGPNAQAPEAEKILSCDPDIVISTYDDAEKADALEKQLGIPVVTLRTGPNGVFDDAFKQSLILLGEIFLKADRASELITFIEGETAEIFKRTSDIPEADKKNVYICGLGSWGTTDHLMTSQDYIAFDIAHVSNAVSGLAAGGVQPIEAEKFVALGGDMDIVIIDAAAVKNIAPLYQEDGSIFDSCKAWQNGKVYLQMAYNAYYTNYETALINTWFIAKTVYPYMFEDIDMAAKTNEITEMFLGKELADDIFAAPSSFGGYQRIDTATFFG